MGNKEACQVPPNETLSTIIANRGMTLTPVQASTLYKEQRKNRQSLRFDTACHRITHCRNIGTYKRKAVYGYIFDNNNERPCVLFEYHNEGFDTSLWMTREFMLYDNRGYIELTLADSPRVNIGFCLNIFLHGTDPS